MRLACKLNLKLLFALAALCLANTASAADGIDFTPGKYEIKNNRNDKVTTECYKGKRLTAAVLEKKMNKNQPGDSPCRITEKDKTATELDLSMACKYPDGAIVKAQMTVTVDGNEFQAESGVTLLKGGQTRRMKATSSGKRIGDC